MRACSTTRFPSEFHPSRRSFRPHLARRCTRVLVEHIAPSTPHHLTKKRKNPNFDDDGKAHPSASTETRLESRPAMASVLFCSISLARKKNNDAPSFLFFFASKRQRTLPQHNFVERESFYYCRERETLRGGQKGLKNI